MSVLVSELPRVNGWSIARHGRDRTPDRTQRLLNHASWDTSAAMSVVRRFAAMGLDAAARRRAGMVIGAIDETGQEKAGEATAGVKRQYMGCAGRVANGINTVHLSYVRDKTGHALIGGRQWIPREPAEHGASGTQAEARNQVAASWLIPAPSDGGPPCTATRRHHRLPDRRFWMTVRIWSSRGSGWSLAGS